MGAAQVPNLGTSKIGVVSQLPGMSCQEAHWQKGALHVLHSPMLMKMDPQSWRLPLYTLYIRS